MTSICNRAKYTRPPYDIWICSDRPHCDGCPEAHNPPSLLHGEQLALVPRLLHIWKFGHSRMGHLHVFGLLPISVESRSTSGLAPRFDDRCFNLQKTDRPLSLCLVQLGLNQGERGHIQRLLLSLYFVPPIHRYVELLAMNASNATDRWLLLVRLSPRDAIEASIMRALKQIPLCNLPTTLVYS